MTTESSAGRVRPLEWLGVILVAVIWFYTLIQWLLDIETFAGFLLMVATYLVITLLFIGWWFTRRSFTLGQRFGVLGCALAFGIVIGMITRKAIQPPVYVAIFGIPIVLAVWALWVPLTWRRTQGFRVAGLIVCFLVVWAGFLLIRVNGTTGNMRADLHWRWTPTAEERFLSRTHVESLPTTLPAGKPLQLRPGDWPGFRGPNRDGIVHGLSIDLDWAKSPPAVLWRQPVGPAWSSMAVVDGCVFTQEQHGPREAVVCRDATSGHELWVHEEPARFDEPMSGPGPRATPTFANGRIYAQGATGTLLCLDASTGRLIWSRDIHSDASAALPMWGFANSPLVTSDRVIVFAGGEGKKGLLAYPLDGGAPVWTADAGKVSYASPQAFDVGGAHQAVIFTTEGFFGVDASSGQLLWQFPIERGVGVPSALQACQISPDSFLLGAGAAFGLQRVRVSSDGRSVTREWVTPKMKPSFSDMVYHNGFVYGFDGTTFCCVDVSTGARRWRDGHYGAGQVLLLADQGVMIVSSEKGEAILLRCNPEHNEELGRLPAITGKAWNHPALAGDKLYLRSDAEMACVQLRAIKGP
jgi:outer membrane protein assembly factor BamB